MIAQQFKKYLTEREAANYLGFRPATLRQSRWSGKLAGTQSPKYITFGRNVRYEPAELDRWAKRLAGEVSA